MTTAVPGRARAIPKSVRCRHRRGNAPRKRSFADRGAKQRAHPGNLVAGVRSGYVKRGSLREITRFATATRSQVSGDAEQDFWTSAAIGAKGGTVAELET